MLIHMIVTDKCFQEILLLDMSGQDLSGCPEEDQKI